MHFPPPSQEEHGNHGKSFLTICNSSISLPAVHTCKKCSHPNWLQILQWIYLPKMAAGRQTGSTEQPFQTVCLVRCILLGAGVKRFTWLPRSLINECRLAYLPPDQAQSQSPLQVPQQFWQFFFSSFASEKVSRNLDGNDRRQSVVHSFLGNLYSRMFLCCLIGLGKVSSVVA